MVRDMDFRGRWTLITGASSGLGMEMARVLARDHRAHLVLVARRRDRLDSLAHELRHAHGVDVVCICADLSVPEDVDRVFTEATDGREIYAVILNAGVTYFGHALDLPYEDFQAMLSTNVVSLVRLTTLFVPYLIDQRQGGGVMLVSSLAGFSPMPYQAVYGATKAFVTSFGQSLAEEIRGRGISLTVFAPGGIATEMLDKSGLSRTFKPGSVGIMPADRCAELAVQAFAQRRALYVPGLLNQAAALMMKFLPREFLSARLAQLYRSAL